MLPTSASSGSAATPAPPIRLTWISARREIRRLALVSPSYAAASSAGDRAVCSGAGRLGGVSDRGALPWRGGAPPGWLWRGGAPPGWLWRGGAPPGWLWRGGAPPGWLWRGGAPPGAPVPALA